MHTVNCLNADMVVLCGGKGARLGTMTSVVPKPLLPVGGSPFLLRLLLQWRKEGVGRFLLAAHHLADQFRAFAREHASRLGKVEVVVESEPLGTGGGLKNAAAAAVRTPTFLAANGDSYVSQPLSQVLETHQKIGSSFTLVAVPAAHVIGGARQKGRLAIGSAAELAGFVTEENAREGWINAGVYALSRDAVAQWPSGRYDLERSILTDPAAHRVRVFRSGGNLMDIGIPDCYSLFDRQLGPLDMLFSKLSNLSIPNHHQP